MTWNHYKKIITQTSRSSCVVGKEGERFTQQWAISCRSHVWHKWNSITGIWRQLAYSHQDSCNWACANCMKGKALQHNDIFFSYFSGCIQGFKSNLWHRIACSISKQRHFGSCFVCCPLRTSDRINFPRQFLNMTCLRNEPPMDLDFFSWIERDNCNSWHHQHCIGLEIPANDFDWKCPLCIAEDLMWCKVCLIFLE